MEIGIHKVTTEQKNVLENLMTLFLHDLSEYASEEGRDAPHMGVPA